MNQKFDQYKRKLELERKELLAQISKAEKPEDFGSDVDAGDEETNEAESLGNQLALAQALKARLADIDAALGRIAARTYGICTTCGKNIEDDVLEASPESKLCKQCKKKSG